MYLIIRYLDPKGYVYIYIYVCWTGGKHLVACVGVDSKNIGTLRNRTDIKGKKEVSLSPWGTVGEVREKGSTTQTLRVKDPNNRVFYYNFSRIWSLKNPIIWALYTPI